MFSGGLGTIDAHLVQKEKPEPGMIVTKVGGPVYRIGVGGGAASSVEVQGMGISNDASDNEGRNLIHSPLFSHSSFSFLLHWPSILECPQESQSWISVPFKEGIQKWSKS
jgi:hypothetical protein